MPAGKVVKLKASRIWDSEYLEWRQQANNCELLAWKIRLVQHHGITTWEELGHYAWGIMITFRVQRGTSGGPRPAGHAWRPNGAACEHWMTQPCHKTLTLGRETPARSVTNRGMQWVSIIVGIAVLFWPSENSVLACLNRYRLERDWMERHEWVRKLNCKPKSTRIQVLST